MFFLSVLVERFIGSPSIPRETYAVPAKAEPVQRAELVWVSEYGGWAVVPIPTYTAASIKAAELAGEDMQDLTNGAYAHLFIEPVDWWFEPKE